MAEREQILEIRIPQIPEIVPIYGYETPRTTFDTAIFDVYEANIRALLGPDSQVQARLAMPGGVRLVTNPTRNIPSIFATLTFRVIENARFGIVELECGDEVRKMEFNHEPPDRNSGWIQFNQENGDTKTQLLKGDDQLFETCERLLSDVCQIFGDPSDTTQIDH